jgi:tetratricopeptide (TPR) repeat protein
MKGAANVLARRSFGQNILAATKDGGSYKLLRIHIVAGRPHVQFRLLSAAGELNYHEYDLTRFPDGKVAAQDVFIYMLGEPLSESVFQLVVPAMNSGKGTLGTPKFDPQQLGAMNTLTSMSQAIQAGDFAKAVAEYGKFPKKWQEEKRVLVLYMQATAGLGAGGEPNYLAAMERFRKLYPNDACVDFISIDYFFLKKQYDDARKAVDHLDKVVGGDPYLDVVRGNCWMEAGRFDEARAALENAANAEPELANACWARIALSLREKKHIDTLAWLKRVVEQCHEQVLDLATLPEYANFVRSPEHALWLTWYGNRAR